MMVTGWLAWFVLWRDRRGPALDGWAPLAVLAWGAVSVLLMLWTARVGGEINHPEIHPGGAAEITGLGLSPMIVDWVFGSSWVWPAMEGVHFLGMALLFGSVLLTAVRVLGFARVVPYAALHRLLPLGVMGFGMNVITGMIFFIVDTARYSAMIYGFYPKMALIVVGGVAAVYFTIFDRPWELKDGADAPFTVKAVAMATVVIWAAVIAYGRLLPYLQDA
jgi:hypothetical protein